MIQEQLVDLGFSKNVIRVYLTLFELGKVRAGQLIDTTGLHRNIVYTALEELVRRGLVTKTLVQGVAAFVANDPVCLIDELEMKKMLALKVAEELRKQQANAPREIMVYEGVEGLKHVRNKALTSFEDSTLHILGGSAYSTLPELEQFWQIYNKKRLAKNIELKALYDRSTPADKLAWRNDLPLTEARYLPFGTDSPIMIGFIEDMIDIVVGKKDPVVFSIRSRDVAEGFKTYFEHFWNQDVSVESGNAAIEREFHSMLAELHRGEEYYIIGGSPLSSWEKQREFFREYHKKRVKKGVVANILVYKEMGNILKEFFREAGDPDGKISHAKEFLNAPATPFQINLYHGKTAIVIFGDNPAVIHIERPAIYEGFKSYFDQLWNQNTQVLEGTQGIIDLCELVLQEEKDLYLIAATGTIATVHEEYYKQFTARRIQKNLHIHMLANEDRRGMPFTKLFLQHVTYLPAAFASPMVVWIFGNYTALVLWHEPQRIFLIHDEKVAEYYRNYYRALEKTAKP